MLLKYKHTFRVFVFGIIFRFIYVFVVNFRYVSMADIIDLSSLVSDSTVRVIDFRVFVSNWCGLNIGDICSESNNVGRRVARIRGQSSKLALLEELRQCGLLLSGYSGSVNDCLYALDEDCRTTVWTYQSDGEDGDLDSFQPDDQLKQKKKISFVRRRRDVYKALGPGSKAESAVLLAFGSLFTAPYKGSESHIDIHEAQNDKRIQSVIQKIDFLPFVPEITKAGREFALQKIKSPFLCAQLRLLDGQFKNHWKASFMALKQKLESLKQNGPLPIHIFVMTDLPMSNWTGSYLGDLVKDTDTFKLFVLKASDDLVVKTAKKIANVEKRKSFNSVSAIKFLKNCNYQMVPDILLYVEESVCSCASLGFVGTAGSTIAESIDLMRKYRTCSG